MSVSRYFRYSPSTHAPSDDPHGHCAARALLPLRGLALLRDLSLDSGARLRALSVLSVKRGRPSLPAGQARVRWLHLRLRPDELQLLQAAAAARHQSVADWARATLRRSALRTS